MHRIRILRIPKSFRIRQITILANPNLNRDFESNANPNGIISPMRIPCESTNPANPKYSQKKYVPCESYLGYAYHRFLYRWVETWSAPPPPNVPLWSKIGAPIVALFWLFGKQLVYSRGVVCSEWPSVPSIFMFFSNKKHINIQIYNTKMSFNQISRANFLYNTQL